MAAIIRSLVGSQNPTLLRREANKQTHTQTNKKESLEPTRRGGVGGEGVDFTSKVFSELRVAG